VLGNRLPIWLTVNSCFLAANLVESWNDKRYPGSHEISGAYAV
jgi:hypothetical protein